MVLGSGSPRRAEILRRMGCRFEVLALDTEEIHDAIDPVRTVSFNAMKKYRACRRQRPEAALIAADTLVWFDGRLIGKPADPREAAEFLRSFSGRDQFVFTAVVMGLPPVDPERIVEVSSVRFKLLSEDTIADYLRRASPLDRAGAYDIDVNGDQLIAAYSGSYTNIMGLPRSPVKTWLTAQGLL